MTKRLIFSYLAITVIILVLLEVPFGAFYAQREVDRLTAEIERDTSILATVYRDSLEANVRPDPQEAESYASRTGNRIVLVDSRGISLIDTSLAPRRNFSTRPEIALALSGERATGRRQSETLGTEAIYVAVPIIADGMVLGALRITVETSEIDRRVERFWWGLTSVGIIVLLAIAVIGWLIARSVTLPLRILNDTARRFGQGDLAVEQREAKGPPELRQLSDTLSTMAGQLAMMIDQQRAFVADASHQLRTPLTALRLRLENFQATAQSADVGAIEIAIEEIDRLSRLVTDLLQLARTDRLDPPVPTDLTTIVVDRVDTWTAAADNAQVHLELPSDLPYLTVLAVPGAIEQIMDNVLDNAIGHSPVGASVSVVLQSGGEAHLLIITDQGPGLSDEDKSRALNRFWRGNANRSGTGLGLAIADGLARASGGSLTLHDGPTGGLQVRIALPV